MVAMFSFTKCNEVKEDKQAEGQVNFSAANYVGGSACVNCHKEIYESHIGTAHSNTTVSATINKISGSFEDGKNSYRFSSRTIVKCEKDGDKLYQVAYVDSVEKMRQEFDIVFGFGRKAQSFASWSKDKLVQLPLSYFNTVGAWINSPGYPEKVVFNRVITSRCLECHTTYAQVTSQEGLLENFNRSNIVLGIDCEKCHGPASDHVVFKTKNPTIKDEKYIINPARFTRQQSLDACALCHSGNMESILPSLSFRPGDELKKFYTNANATENMQSLDVHGNQYGLLTLSKCFILSQMTCVSCHNSHKNEGGDLHTLSQRCMNCHSPDNKNTFCKVANVDQTIIKQNCIDCHMPQKESATIVFSNHESDKKMAAKMRTHYIKIYRDETKQVIDFLKKKVKL